MKIIVCVKQVVDTTDIKWTKNNTIDRENAESVVNPCDLLALETAIRIKEDIQESKVIAISMGPTQAETALKTAIAMGCDEAYLICDKKFSGADTVATSYTLSKAIEHVCPDYDLIICGQYAQDGDTAQTGPSIAQKLGIEQITYVTELKPLSQSTEGTVTAVRKADEAIEVIEAPLPAVLCVAECPYNPRDVKINGYIKAQDYKVCKLNATAINTEPETVGLKGSPTWVSRAYRAESHRANEICTPENSLEAVKILSAYISDIKSSSDTEGAQNGV